MNVPLLKYYENQGFLEKGGNRFRQIFAARNPFGLDGLQIAV
jgi:hypothetical protein